MTDSISALLRLLPFPAVYAASPPIVSPSLSRLMPMADCVMLFSDPTHVPSRLALGDSTYQITPSPEDPALFFLTPERESTPPDASLHRFLTDITSPLSNLVLMGSLLGRSDLPANTAPYIHQMRRITDQIIRLHYNASPHAASFEQENLPELIRDTLGYVGYYLPQLSLSFSVEGDGDPTLYLSKPHVEGLILNLISELLTLSDRSGPQPEFRFTLLLKDAPCLVVRVESPSISVADVEELLFSPEHANPGFLFIRHACRVHHGALFVRRDGQTGFSLTFTFPQNEEFPHSVSSFTTSYTGYEQARMLLSNHLELSCYEHVKR